MHWDLHATKVLDLYLEELENGLFQSLNLQFLITFITARYISIFVFVKSDE